MIRTSLLDAGTLQIDVAAQRARKSEIPVIIIAGHANVPTAIWAMTGGASDFIDMSIDSDELLERIRHWLSGGAQRWCTSQRAAERLSGLTRRERKVVEGLPQVSAIRKSPKICLSIFVPSSCTARLLWRSLKRVLCPISCVLRWLPMMKPS